MQRTTRIIIINPICIILLLSTLLLLSPHHQVHGLACPVKPFHSILQQQSPKTPSTVLPSTSDGASALELWTVNRLETLYQDSQLKIKCPFFRRRASDLLESMDMVARFLVIRHKSILDLPSLGVRAAAAATQLRKPKSKHLDVATISQLIHDDWKPTTHKGYYITGRLNQTIYRDDCSFDGPDPDMPVRGLTKYIKASQSLFDTESSEAILLNLTIVNAREIRAHWKLQNCVLRLPWRPMLPTWTGTTSYHLGKDDGLIYLHEETWDMSAMEAFCRTFFSSWMSSQENDDDNAIATTKVSSRK